MTNRKCNDNRVIARRAQPDVAISRYKACFAVRFDRLYQEIATAERPRNDSKRGTLAQITNIFAAVRSADGQWPLRQVEKKFFRWHILSQMFTKL